MNWSFWQDARTWSFKVMLCVVLVLAMIKMVVVVSLGIMGDQESPRGLSNAE